MSFRLSVALRKTVSPQGFMIYDKGKELPETKLQLMDGPFDGQGLPLQGHIITWHPQSTGHSQAGASR